MDECRRRPTVNRIDSKDEFVTEKERKRPSEQARAARLNILHLW